MFYDSIQIGTFVKRPNRFISHIIIDGKEEIVHVKNTGRCKELLVPGATVLVNRANKEQRKTKWDLIAVQKGHRLINMDAQAPNAAVKEWLLKGKLFPEIKELRSEVTFQKSRFDFRVIHKVNGREKTAFIEVKGVTLERDNAVLFPDAPSPRALRHLEELKDAVAAGYEAYVILVVQMSDVAYFTPNQETDPGFAKGLLSAHEAGVHVLAADCIVSENSMTLHQNVPVVFAPALMELRPFLIDWYRKNKRDLPWRHTTDAYAIWVSEIMLQQTRVEAVRGYYTRFMEALPNIEALALAKEDVLLKLWEGLGYYNRVRNMQMAAQEIQSKHGGIFPKDYALICALKGIGSYTGGAIASFAFQQAVPAVDGNVLRVVARLLGDDTDVKSDKMKKRTEFLLKAVIPAEAASDFNQGLIELGALVCLPMHPKCAECPISAHCIAFLENRVHTLPVRSKGKARRVEKKTVLLLREGDTYAIQKRPSKGLLSGLYELPNAPGHLTRKEVTQLLKTMGLKALRIKALPEAVHIFTHIRWEMIGYEIKVDELENQSPAALLFIKSEDINEKYPIPSAFDAYRKIII